MMENLSNFLTNIKKLGFQVSTDENWRGFRKIILRVPDEIHYIKKVQNLYVGTDGYFVSLIYGEISMNEWEIYDDNQFFSGIMRFHSLEEAENFIFNLLNKREYFIEKEEKRQRELLKAI